MKRVRPVQGRRPRHAAGVRVISMHGSCEETALTRNLAAANLYKGIMPLGVRVP